MNHYYTYQCVNEHFEIARDNVHHVVEFSNFPKLLDIPTVIHKVDQLDQTDVVHYF